MSVVSGTARATIVARAGNRCEYCHLPTRGQVATFPVDHILPRHLSGETVLDNLALACPHCNAYKWIHTKGPDAFTGETAPLFNPRTHVWSDHFAWSKQQSGFIDGKTPSGRATVDRLQMNSQEIIAIRQLLSALALFEELPDSA